MARLRACCVTHSPRRVRGDSGDVDAPRAVIDEEQDVERSEPRGLHSEEVATDDGACLGSQERFPGDTPSWRGIQAGGVEDVGDRGGGHAEAELEQLAADALIAPARVLAGEAADEVAEVRSDGGPATLAVSVSPLAGDQLAMPTQEGVGCDHEAAPSVAREHTAGGSQEGAVCGAVSRARHLALEDRQLLAEDDDLNGILGLAAPRHGRHLEETEEPHVEGR